MGHMERAREGGTRAHEGGRETLAGAHLDDDQRCGHWHGMMGNLGTGICGAKDCSMVAPGVCTVFPHACWVLCWGTVVYKIRRPRRY